MMTLMSPSRENEISGKTYYFGTISRELADAFLLDSGCEKGVYLVRRGTEGYRLSLLSVDGASSSTFHYRIGFDDVSRTYHIDSGVRFSSIPALIRYYSDPAQCGLVHCLTTPCPKLEFADEAFKGVKFFEQDLISITETNMHEARYAKICKGFIFQTHDVALKSKSQQEEQQLSIMKECAHLNILRHEHVIPLLGVINTSPPRLVLKFCGNKDILDYLLNNGSYESPFYARIKMIKQVTSALNHVTKMGFVHRNIRATNVLLESNMNCKLSGFSHTRKVDDSGCYYAKKDDPDFSPTYIRWMAIEAAKDKCFSAASDVWSLAALMQEIFTNGEAPYSGEITSRVFERVQCGIRPSKPENVPDAVYSLMLQCWYPQVEMRPTLTHVEKILSDFQDPGGIVESAESFYEVFETDSSPKEKKTLRKKVKRYITMRKTNPRKSDTDN